jgi:glucose-6-phosphate isomerase
MEVEPKLTSGDYLQGFYLGTRYALAQNGRPSISIAVPNVSAYSVGMLIALFERTVGLYANLLGINAYHQPGVEAGKKAATEIVKLKARLISVLETNGSVPVSVEDLAKSAGTDDYETVFIICKRLISNKMTHICAKDDHVPSKAMFFLD